MTNNKGLTPAETNIDSLFDDVRNIINAGLEQSVSAVQRTACLTYWRIGQRIVEEEQQGARRAEYGKQMLENLAGRLNDEYGKNSNYTARDLRNYRQFFLTFSDFQIWYACVPNLTWTHYRALLRVDNPDARKWYIKEANNENVVYTPAREKYQFAILLPIVAINR